MPRKSDEIIKSFIGQVGTMIDALHKTLEINLKAHVDDAIKKSEERICKDMATKDDIKKLENIMATKEDILRLEKKIDKTTELQHQLDILKERVKTLEENARIRN
jgi:hypothetical protein